MSGMDREKRRENLLQEVRLRMLGTGVEQEAARLERGLVILLREPDEEQPIDQSRIHALNRKRRNNSGGEQGGPITPSACTVPIRFHALGTHIGYHGGH